MKLTKKIESEVWKVYDTWLHSYLNGDVETYNSYLDNDFHFIGSAKNEEFLNRKDSTNFFEATGEEFAGKTELRNETKIAEQFGELVFITHIFDAWFLNENDWTYYARFRFSSTLKKNDEGWRFIYQHFSIPDSKTDDGGTIGYDKINEENQELREAIKRRTVELEHKNRELEIETALERVRANAMSMNTSDNLKETVSSVFSELIKLGLHTIRCGIGIFDDQSNKVNVWTASEDKSKNIAHLSGDEYLQGHPLLEGIYKHWRLQKEFSYTLKGNDLLNYYKEVSESNLPVSSPENFKKDLIQYYYCDYFPAGGLFAFKDTEFSESDKLLMKRFAKVFHLSFIRHQDLKKAEAQAREGEIELALERVRARTMAMQKSEELKEVIQVVYDQFVRLNVNVEHAGFIINYKEREDMHIWLADRNNIQNEITFPYFDSPHWNSFLEAKVNDLDFFANQLNFEVKNKFYTDLFEFIPGLPEEIKQYYLSVPTLAISTVLMDNVGLYIENFDGIPYTDEENKILMRFGKVFQQTYTRFLDLQKAEAQAREAKIEAALERVRAKAMAMHSSEDLSQTVNAFFNELKTLNLSMRRCGVGIVDVASKMVDVHVTTETQTKDSKMMTGKLTLSGHPVLNQILETFIRKEEYHPVLRGKELLDYYQTMNPEVEYPDFAEDDVQYGYYFHFKEGGVFTWTDKKLAEVDLQIFRRYTSVLSLTYRRYLELKEAEAQAREAKIEAALEKVRSRSLAMHKPDELQEVIAVVAEKLTELGVIFDAGGVILCTYFPDNKDVVHWIVAPDFSHSGSYFVPYFDNPIFKDAWDSKIRGDAYFSKEFPVEAKNHFFEYAFEHSDYKHFPEDYKKHVLEADKHNLSATWSKNSAIIIPSLNGVVPSEADAEIMIRFAKVFEQTYIRFMDLQKAEERARESQIDIALERVRSRTMGMQKSDELAKTSAVLFQQIKDITPETWSCGFCIWQENDEVELWMGADSGGILPPMLIPYKEEPTHKDIYKASLNGAVEYNKIWKGKALKEHYAFLRTIPSVAKAIKVMEDSGLTLPDQQCYYVGFFKHGYLLLITKEPNDNLIELSKRFTNVFDLTYTRFLDLQLKEKQSVELLAEKQRLEITLSDLQTTQKQLIQSEKMASLGELTAGIAHEIQNPLNFVNNFSEVSNELLEEMMEEMATGNYEEAKELLNDIKQNLEKINHHGKRADGIVKGMLQHSRKSSAVKEPTDINKLADEYLRLAYHGLRAKDKSFNATLETDFDKSIGLISVIPQDMGRVILNLITNAFYACTERSRSTADERKNTLKDENFKPTISVSTKKVKDTIEILVKDNGNGIPQKVLDKIFQPFFTTKPTGQGTGLGLSLSYDIVKAHGGELTVETEEGKGTTFIINLPL